MSILHWWAIPIGVAALSVPLIVHWLTKPHPTRVPLSTVRFVRELIQQRRARNRLRDWLILLLRVAAIALLAAVMARPLAGRRAPAAAGNSETQAVKLVVLDVSQSLAATSQGIQAFERARALAAKHVAYRAGTECNLILAAAIPQPIFDRPSANFATLASEVARAQALPQRLQAQAALNLAGEMLAKAGGEKARHELVIVSDFQRSNWAAADFSILPADTNIQLESIAPAETPANLAILRVGSQGRIDSGRPFRLEVDVGNYSPTPRQVTVEVALGESLFRLQGQCAAGGRSTLVSQGTLGSAGWHVGEARLVGVEDGLAKDDTRPVVLQVHPQPTYLLLTRQSADMRPSSSYFIERAISPLGGTEARVQEKVIRIDPSRADREILAAADLLVLDHPGRLSEESLQLLAGLLRRGRGMLYIASEPLDAANLKLLAKAAGTSLQMPVEFAPPLAGQARKNLFLIDVRRRETPFTIFGEDASSIFSPVRFNGGLTSRRVEGALLDDVLATYNDRSACLVMTACGAGTLAVLNAELGASNLPSSPAFVPLIGELTSHLLGRNRAQEAAACGEPLAVYLPAAASPVSGLRIESPPGTDVDRGALGELHEENIGVMWQAPAAGPPGVYEIKRNAEIIYAQASAIPPEEADLATLAPEVMTDRLSGGRLVNYRSALREEEPRDDLWSWLAVACLGCLFAEILGLRLFKS